MLPGSIPTARTVVCVSQTHERVRPRQRKDRDFNATCQPYRCIDSLTWIGRGADPPCDGEVAPAGGSASRSRVLPSPRHLVGYVFGDLLDSIDIRRRERCGGTVEDHRQYGKTRPSSRPSWLTSKRPRREHRPPTPCHRTHAPSHKPAIRARRISPFSSPARHGCRVVHVSGRHPVVPPPNPPRKHPEQWTVTHGSHPRSAHRQGDLRRRPCLIWPGPYPRFLPIASPERRFILPIRGTCDLTLVTVVRSAQVPVTAKTSNEPRVLTPIVA